MYSYDMAKEELRNNRQVLRQVDHCRVIMVGCLFFLFHFFGCRTIVSPEMHQTLISSGKTAF
jgi:hypothetical protein